MKTARELLNELNSLDESARIEAKTGSQIGKSIHETSVRSRTSRAWAAVICCWVFARKKPSTTKPTK